MQVFTIYRQHCQLNNMYSLVTENLPTLPKLRGYELECPGRYAGRKEGVCRPGVYIMRLLLKHTHAQIHTRLQISLAVSSEMYLCYASVQLLILCPDPVYIEHRLPRPTTWRQSQLTLSKLKSQSQTCNILNRFPEPIIFFNKLSPITWTILFL